jgi:hypothetical protein
MNGMIRFIRRKPSDGPSRGNRIFYCRVQGGRVSRMKCLIFLVLNFPFLRAKSTKADLDCQGDFVKAANADKGQPASGNHAAKIHDQ